MEFQGIAVHCRCCGCRPLHLKPEDTLETHLDHFHGLNKPVHGRQRKDSLPCLTADEHCFSRSSDSDAQDTAVNTISDCLNPLSFPTMVPFPSPGILACSAPAVVASTSSAELPQLLGHGGRLLSRPSAFQEGHSRTNQVLGRKCHSRAEDMSVSVDLVSAP